jgi:BlaI family transcriptional regulator, penicillinase repressor
MRARKPVLTEQELEIMKIVWDLEQATVRQVYEAILEQRHIAYTTVMTMMKILEGKGYLKKSQEDRAYIYRPAEPKTKVVGGMVSEFVARVFNGSARPLLVHLVAEEGLTEKELAEIARLARKQK